MGEFITSDNVLEIKGLSVFDAKNWPRSTPLRLRPPLIGLVEQHLDAEQRALDAAMDAMVRAGREEA